MTPWKKKGKERKKIKRIWRDECPIIYKMTIITRNLFHKLLGFYTWWSTAKNFKVLKYDHERLSTCVPGPFLVCECFVSHPWWSSMKIWEYAFRTVIQIWQSNFFTSAESNNKRFGFIFCTSEFSFHFLVIHFHCTLQRQRKSVLHSHTVWEALKKTIISAILLNNH